MVSAKWLKRSMEEVAGSIPVDPNNFYIAVIGKTRGATWQPVIGPRGTFPFARTVPRVKT
jgi:hypothetical protein